MNVDELITEITQLPVLDKWRLFKKRLDILNQQQIMTRLASICTRDVWLNQ